MKLLRAMWDAATAKTDMHEALPPAVYRDLIRRVDGQWKLQMRGKVFPSRLAAVKALARMRRTATAIARSPR